MRKSFLFVISIAMAAFMTSCEKAVLEETDGENPNSEVVKSGAKDIVHLKMTRDGGAMLGIMNAREPKHTEVIYGVNVYEKKGGGKQLQQVRLWTLHRSVESQDRNV